MKDVQKEKDNRNVKIDKVGVKIPQYRLVIEDKKDKIQHIIASVDMSVSLPATQKGTHMSRFIQVLNKYHNKPLSSRHIAKILREIMSHLEAEDAFIELSFPYFIEKEAPVSKIKSDMDYNCKFIGNIMKKGNLNLFGFKMVVEVPISSVCPCSMAISNVGAHNQRGIVTVTIDSNDFIWLEDIIDIIESSGSSDVFSILKREDEKYITEKMFTNPKFVEDIARDVFIKLKKLIDNKTNMTNYYSVEVENFESIHNHNAYAFIESKDI